MPISGIDNDILLKGAAYGLLREMVEAIPARPEEIGVLGSAKFALPTYLKRAVGGEQAATKEIGLSSLFEAAIVLEPSDEELALAAEFELIGQREQLNLDGGESQLFAMLGSGRLTRVASGDKRAAISLHKILDKRRTPEFLRGKLVCLEQIVLRVLGKCDVAAIRAAICNNRAVDKTLTICFSCLVEALPSESAVIDCLNSYVDALRSETGHLLEPT